MHQHHHLHLHEPRNAAPQVYGTPTVVGTTVVETVYQVNPTTSVVSTTVRSVGYPVAGSSTSSEPTSTSTSTTTPPAAPYPVPVRHQKPHTSSSTSTTSSYHVPVRHQRPQTTASTKHSTKHKHKTKHSTKYTTHTHKHFHTTIKHTKIKTSTSSHVPGHTGSLIGKHPNGQNSQASSEDTGLSGGATAGLTIGLILALCLIGGLAFFFWQKKKNKNERHQPLDDEKTDLFKSQPGLVPHVSVRRTVANAPRLSLRPVTELFPTMSEKQESNSSANTLSPNSAASARAKTPQGFRAGENGADDHQDPFGDHAEAEESNVQAPPAAVPKPLSIKSERAGTGLNESAMPNSNNSDAAAGAASSNPRRLSPPGPGPNNVHRVQLDFNPSMDDELGLRAGQLVRMLHEYDDGWALCIRLDRSQQGVVPRTCLSKVPVKPRPQGPPPGARGPPPQGRPRGPANAPSPRMPPPGARSRSQSNSPRQAGAEGMGGRMGGPPRARANSDALSARRITPPGMAAPVDPNSTSPTQGGASLNRKPVPGQAI